MQPAGELGSKSLVHQALAGDPSKAGEARRDGMHPIVRLAGTVWIAGVTGMAPALVDH